MSDQPVRAEITRGRYDGPGLGPTGAWTCPSCRTKNTTPFEAGCPSCGAGTDAERHAAVTKREARASDAQLQTAVVGTADLYTATLAGAVTNKARLTVARALAHYAETSTPSPHELSRVEILTWGRLIAQAVDDEEQARTSTP